MDTNEPANQLANGLEEVGFTTENTVYLKTRQLLSAGVSRTDQNRRQTPDGMDRMGDPQMDI